MKKPRLFLIAALIAAATAVYGQLKHVAVVETEVDPAAKITKAEALEITDALRREAINNLTRGKYNIMTSETIQSMGEAVLEKCTEENCVVSFGEMVGADYVVRGAVRKVGAKLSVAVSIHEIDHGMLVALSDKVMADNIEELIEKVEAVCAKMFKKFESEQAVILKGPVTSTPTPTPPVYQPPVPTPTPTPPPTPAPTNQQASGGGSVGAPAVIEQSRNVPGRPSVSTFTDSRDGKKYKTVVIGGKRWMAQNLNHQPQSGKSWCYNNNDLNCDRFGRLYDWKMALSVCPIGYHLPSRQEWNDLETAAGGSSVVAGKKLKATSGWSNNGNGTDDYGWSALPGGYRGPADNFYAYAGYYGRWWTAAEGGSGNAYNRCMSYNNDRVNEDIFNVGYGLSVRCVAD